MSNFRMYPELMLSFEHNSICENQFLIACFCWDFELFSPEIDQNSKFAGTIGYIASYLEFLFPQFKIFTLHAKLHDAAGAVRAQSCKSPGYCYMVGRGQTISRSWEFSLIGMFKNTHFVLQESTNPQSKSFGVQETCTELSGAVDVWTTMSLQAFLLELYMVNLLQEGQKNARFLAISSTKRWKICNINVPPKFLISLMKKCGSA